MKLFTNEDEVENYLYDINKTMKEVTKTVFSFSEVQYVHSKVLRYTPDVLRHIAIFSYNTSKPVVYHSAKWVMCSLLVSNPENDDDNDTKCVNDEDDECKNVYKNNDDSE
jgi:hypothetical protein